MSNVLVYDYIKCLSTCLSNVLVYDYIKCLSTCLVASTSSQYIDYIINMIKYSKLSSAL